MTPKNSYATLLDFKNYIRSRGGEVANDALDDGVVEFLLEAASAYVNDETTRTFYPQIETDYYSLPADRELWFDKDVQEILSLLNGDGSSITASAYQLMPRNATPRYGLKLKETSSVTWLTDTSGNSEHVIALQSINGYHNQYSMAWKAVTTLAEALDTTELGFDLTDAALVQPGHILRIGNEITIVDSKAVNTVTVLQRGDNGSTAATASNGATVYVWQTMKACQNACIEIANSAYRRRYGQSATSNTETVTAAGVVLSPRDIPTMAKTFIAQYEPLV